MFLSYRSLLIPLLILAFVGSGCEKRPPQGARELRQPSEGVRNAPTVSEYPDGSLRVGPVRLQVPAGWRVVPPSSAMRLAQFSIPAEGDGQPGEMTVFYFGPDAGGIEPNIARWMNQFERPDGSAITTDQVVREEFTAHGMPVILVRFEGTQRPSTMPGVTPTPALRDYMNVSGIVTTPEGPWFFKGTGPSVTMRRQVSTIEEFFRTMRYVGQ